MAYTTINKHTEHFTTKLYTGTGSSNSITGVGFNPDLVWIKCRDNNFSHTLTDKVRGTSKELYTNGSGAETVYSQGVTAFDSDGFTLGTDTGINGSGQNKVSWNWKAGGTGSANTDGSINSTVSVNTTAGFSIVSYTGTGSNPATVGHGLGVTPKMIIVKPRSIAYSWCVYHQGPGAGNLLYVDTTGAAGGSSFMNSTSPTSSVFTVNDNQVNKSGETHIAYCFAEKIGYSKVDSYTGNGNANGAFVYTGFKPQFIFVKNYSNSQSWYLLDIKRDTYNPMRTYLHADGNTADQDHIFFDFYSNGFKARNTVGGYNANGDNYIYMVFGQSLVGSNNVPCTAR